MTDIGYGIGVTRYCTVVFFRSEDALLAALAHNENMEALIGLDDYSRAHFPGVYAAGVIVKEPKATIAQDKSNARNQADAETELLKYLTPDALKELGESLADIVRQYDLQRSPDTCRKLFSYFSDVINAWNSV